MTNMISRKVAVGIHGLAVLAVLATAAPASAQLEAPGAWRLSAAVGAFTARDAAIATADGRDTRLGAGPSFALELQYAAAGFAGVFVSGTGAFTSLARGAEIQAAASGPSDQVTIMAATGGVVLSTGALHPAVLPTLRLGGGIKGYFFDLRGADTQWRPTGDIGLGFRSAGLGPVDVGAEVRYLPSTFDQAGLPTRGIVAQEQRQTDLVFSVGVGIRM